jgi:crossover junction endodeoxyribonuclease RuvC
MEKIEQRETEFVLAIDPALSTTGYAVINMNTQEIAYANKFTTSPKKLDDERINEIVAKLFCVASQYPIRHIILEDGYLGPNPRTANQLAMLRGAIIGVFSFNRYIVHYLLPSQIRKMLGVGGSAKKEQIAKKITELYPNNKKLEIIGPYSDKQNKDKTSDIYDAIGIGVAFIKSRNGGSDNEKESTVD